ncbi:DUF2953 domain-containing protein [Siminovitchia sp. 179-K 8D1 HS]|uniref:DUF2953 domain-containing protein n=1 Tax=Siminovitchia sp. 179-K 8D1 HS TaxID=3142385 RepID=UPI00399F3349
MSTVFIIMAIIAVIFVPVILLSNVKTAIQLKANLSECILAIHIRFLYGLIRVKKQVDIKELLIKRTENEEAAAEVFFRLPEQSGFERMKEMRPFLLKQLNKFSIRRFVWYSRVGLDDAASAGTLCGIVWILKGVAAAWLKNLSCMKCEPQMTLDPCFQSNCAETNLSCMVSIRTGKAIWTMLQIYVQRKKLKDGRTDDGTSNQRFNDNGHGEFKRNDRCKHDHRRSG